MQTNLLPIIVTNPSSTMSCKSRKTLALKTNLKPTNDWEEYIAISMRYQAYNKLFVDMYMRLRFLKNGHHGLAMSAKDLIELLQPYQVPKKLSLYQIGPKPRKFRGLKIDNILVEKITETVEAE